MVNLEELRVQRLLEGSLIHLGMHRRISMENKLGKSTWNFFVLPISPLAAHDNQDSILQLLPEAGHVQGQPAAHHREE